ncbi:hypothetical protein LXL04_038713 [Taraxacum kok-saghyz]
MEDAADGEGATGSEFAGRRSSKAIESTQEGMRSPSLISSKLTPFNFRVFSSNFFQKNGERNPRKTQNIF